MDRQPGAFVRPLGDRLACLHVAVHAVFRPEQCDEFDARRAAQQVNRRFAVPIDAGRIGDEADVFSLQLFESICGEQIAAELHLRRRNCNQRQHRRQKKDTNQTAHGRRVSGIVRRAKCLS